MFSNVTGDIRKKFIEFFKTKSFIHMPHSSIVCNDDTTLFTVAGMKQFTPWFKNTDLADNHRNVVTVQPCLRIAGKHDDLENIGVTNRHNTLFEMLGIFSFGELTKQKTIEYMWEFITQCAKIDTRYLYVTVYENDDEAYNIWTNIVDPRRIARAKMDTNFWSVGDVGLCGPCSEIFFDKQQTSLVNEYQSVYLEDRFLEVANMVFMAYDKRSANDTELQPLPRLCIDVGVGLERLSSVMQKTFDNYQSSTIYNIICSVRHDNDITKRIIADHMRSIVFLVASEVIPSATNHGHVLRRLIRRVISFYIDLQTLDIKDMYIQEVVAMTVKCLSYYKELQNIESKVISIINNEVEDIKRILVSCSAHFNTEMNEKRIVFLHTTYGLPINISLQWCQEHNIPIDMTKINEMQSKQASKILNLPTQKITVKECYNTLELNAIIIEIFDVYGESVNELYDEGYIILNTSPFYPRGGGQIGDEGRLISKNAIFNVKEALYQKVNVNSGTIIHTGVIIQGVLRKGDHVQAIVNADVRQARSRAHTTTHILCDYLFKDFKIRQAGSKVSSDYFTFDFEHDTLFAHSTQITAYINYIIARALPVTYEIVPKQQVMHLIHKDTYSDYVRVITIRDGNTIYSQQLCGGTHVSNTADIMNFKIQGEKGIGHGIRRFTCITGNLENQKEQVSHLEFRRHKYADNVHIIEIINGPHNASFDIFNKNVKECNMLLVYNIHKTGTNMRVKCTKDIAIKIKDIFECMGNVSEKGTHTFGTRRILNLQQIEQGFLGLISSQ